MIDAARLFAEKFSEPHVCPRVFARGTIRSVSAGDAGRGRVEVDGIGPDTLVCDWSGEFDRLMSSTYSAPVYVAGLIGATVLVAFIDDQPVVLCTIVIGDKS